MSENVAGNGSAVIPLRVAIVGAGPAGFYTAEHLLKSTNDEIFVDLFDMLPTPYGLVRFGVAPDHEKIKNVTRKFDATAARPTFRYFGNVEIGRDITVADLRERYHQIVYTCGAQIDRSLGIPGEDLPGSYSATEFVAWYNGHPDFIDREFDLSQIAVAIVGVGNVAVDVARILARPVKDLESTDMADYAIDALRTSGIKSIYLLGRRGPAQAAFTNPEAKELGQLEDVTVVVDPQEVDLDPISKEELATNPDRLTEKKVQMIQDFVGHSPGESARTLHIRFLVSPTEIVEVDGRVGAIKLVRNKLVQDDKGRIRPVATGETETIPVGLVFRSVGYRGTAIPGVPFNDDWGIIRNKGGRVVDENGEIVIGEYTAGWIKRGPSGVIGTNKADALATVETMLEDAAAKHVLSPTAIDGKSIELLLSTRNVDWVSWSEWEDLDAKECAAGTDQGRPRVKFTAREQMLQALRSNGA